MKISPSIRNLLLIWLGWAVIMIGFQGLVQMRVSLERPDNVLSWTSSETGRSSNATKAFLTDPFLNAHVAWDSEYYLAIAVDGYDSSRIPGVSSLYRTDSMHSFMCRPPKYDCYSLSYAFFPLYSVLIKVVGLPLRLFGLTPIATATLAAIMVALLGALAAMLSLYQLSRQELGEEGGVRAAFYLLIFPSGFFLAQVYSEGVFLGLIFSALALLNARKWGWAALCGALAVWARPGGAILLLPFVVIWIKDKTWRLPAKQLWLRLLAALAPALSYGIWRITPLAQRFFIVEEHFFSRGLLAIRQTLLAWSYAGQQLLQGNSSARFYYGLEFAAILLALLTCLMVLKKRPELALFGLAMVVFCFTSGSAQGMVRYVLATPPLFLMLARWSKHPAFDRLWTLACVLIMGLEAMLFTFNFWVA